MPASPHDRQRALTRLQQEIAACDACVAAGFIPVAKPIFRGHAGHRLMVVGQAPGTVADAAVVPYSGASGRTLGGWLERAGFPPGALYEQFYLTSLTKCFPGKATTGKGDRAPSAREIALCRAHLDREIALVQPEIVLSLGRLAANALCPVTRPLPLTEIVGSVREAERAGHVFRLISLPHPSGVSRWLNDPANRARVDLALAALRQAVGE